ncbi:transposase domain-containing protein [Sphingopyxis sp. LARHCG72]
MLIQNKLWFTASELEELQLSGLPKRKRDINRLADAEDWKLAVDASGSPLARRHSGHGGGFEYHINLLPAAARADLVQLGQIGDGSARTDAGEGSPGLWQWLERQPEAVRAEAQRRAHILARIDLFEGSGMTRSAAVMAVATAEGISVGTIWNWRRLVEGVLTADRLPALAPRRQGGGVEADIDPELWTELLSDYLRPSQPRWSESYRRIETERATPQGKTMPHSRTLWRKFQREVPEQVVVLRRGGEEKLRRMLPAQIRSVADLHAMELVNIDGHRVDVFVRMPDGRIIRPTMIAIQDVYSRKFLSWRFAETEDMVTARMVFADLFAKWGIPKGLLADNGRAFASKWLTGGAKTRFRFKMRDEDPVGLLVNLGINIHWAKPYRGQSKPIERGFRDLCSQLAKRPEFEGAYTGNKPDAKPDNYGSKAVDYDTFVAVWNAGMEAHNSQRGRRSEMAAGRHSFDEVFEASYARAPIGKATEEALRLALFAADKKRCDRNSGAIEIEGNRYWTEELADMRGKLVTVRFDPENLHAPIHVYDMAGRFIVTAPVWEATGFLDMGAAKKRQRQERDWKKKTKAAVEALDLLSAEELAARMPVRGSEESRPAPGAARMVRPRGHAVVAQMKPLSQVAENPLSIPQGEETIDRLARAAERQLRAID